MPTSLPIEDLLSDERLAALARDRELGVERLLYEDGEIVLQEGDRARELYVLESGALRIETRSALKERDGSKTRRILATIISDDDHLRAFGEMAFFLDGVRTATVRSVGGCRVLRVGEEGVPVFFQRFPDLAIELFADVVEKLRTTTQELEVMKNSQEVLIEERFVGSGEEAVLLEIGNPVQVIHQLVSGSVRLVDASGAERIVTDLDAEGAFLGGEAYLRGALATERAVALPGTTLQVVRGASPEAVICRFPQLALICLQGETGSRGE